MNYLADLSDQDWDRMLKVHLYGTFYGCRGALRHMVPARHGVIVNVSSILGLRHLAGALHYAARKKPESSPADQIRLPRKSPGSASA